MAKCRQMTKICTLNDYLNKKKMITFHLDYDKSLFYCPPRGLNNNQ